MTSSKVFISNLNYSTTEEELRTYLGSEATNVFIPNYFVGFRSSRAKPLGIAYADLPSPEAAEEFINKFDGVPFKERKLRARPHVPFVPDANKKLGPKSSSLYSLSKQVPGNKTSRVNKEEPQSPKEQEYSTNSIFVKGLKAKTSESNLREFFKDYNPTEVKIQKLRGWIRGFKNRAYNAVVTLDLPADKSIDEVIEESKTRKNEWQFLNLMKAYAIKEKKSAVDGAETEAKLAVSEVKDSKKPGEKLADTQESKEAPKEESTKSGGKLVATAASKETSETEEAKSAAKENEVESAATDRPQDDSAVLEDIKSSAENVVISKSSGTDQ